jgi:hypothetical protein
MTELHNFFENKEKANLKENVLIIIFSISMLITLNFPLSFFILVILFAFIELIIYFVERNIIKRLWFFTIILAIIDTITTYYMVLYKKIAIEVNPFVIFLWNNFGVFGEIIRIVMLIGIFSFSYNRLNTGNKRQQLMAIFFILFICLVWFIVVFSNIFQLMQYLAIR